METNQTLTHEVAECLQAAEAAIAKQDWTTANDKLKHGLNLLGDHYVSPDMIDDTGTKLVLADADEKRGALQNAASIRRKILAARLSLWRQKFDSHAPR